MELAYRQNGDYLIPDIEMDTQPTESMLLMKRTVKLWWTIIASVTRNNQ